MPRPSPWSSLAAIAVPVVLVSALGALNPLDAIVRGKWVRAMDCGKGDVTATLCIPADTPAQLADFRAELPERVRGMHEAGASVVALDLELAEADPALLEAVRAGRTVFGTRADGTAVTTDFPSGNREMARTLFVPMVLGVLATADVPHALGVVALAIHRGQPHAARPDGSVDLGDLAVRADGSSLNFMPYEVPFIHWSQRDTWSTAKDRIVFVGACKADRDLTRFGRQPGVVAHSELIETILDQRRVAHVPRAVDTTYALVILTLATWARRRAGRYPALLVGALGFVLAMGVSLTGAWMGLSGPLLAGIAAAVWNPGREG